MGEELSVLGANLLHWIAVRDINRAKLSKQAGMGPSGVSDIINNKDRSPRLQTIEALARALDISIWQLILSPDEKRPEMPIKKGITILPKDRISEAQRIVLAASCESIGRSADSAEVGEVMGIESLAFGYMPASLLLIVPASDYSGEIVAAQTSDPGRDQAPTLRYCSPPWLIGFHALGQPFHEFMESPGLRIIGLVRPFRLAPE